MDCDTDKLRFNASSWFPGIGYLADNKYWDNIPNSGILQSDNLPKQAKGMFTYVPTDQAYSASNIHMKLPAWGSNFGSKEEREAWMNGINGAAYAQATPPASDTQVCRQPGVSS